MLSRGPCEPRYNFAFATLGDDRHFVIGGENGSRHYLTTVVEYNSTSKTFTTHTPLPQARSSCTATAIDDHRLLVVGGKLDNSARTLKTCVVYDTRTKEWSQDWPELNTGRRYHSCVTTNNKVYVVGGRYHCMHTTDCVEELDLSAPSPRWTILPQRLKTKRGGCRTVVDPNNTNNIIVVGGSNIEDEYLASCEIISLQQEQGEQTRTMPPLLTPHADHSMVVVQNRFLVVMGGRTNDREHVSSVEFLDLEECPQEQQQWHPLPSMRNSRSFFAAFASPRYQAIVVVCGESNRNKGLDTMEELQVRYVEQRASQQAPERLQDGSPLPNRPRLHQPQKPPPLPELPSGCLDTTHKAKVERWLIESEEQMAAFVAQIDANEGELLFEGDKNIQSRNHFAAKVNTQRRQARAFLACIQDMSAAGNDRPSNTAGMPGSDGLTASPQLDFPPMFELQMDEMNRRRIKVWIEENEKRLSAFVSAVETRQAELVKELDENRKLCDEYVGQVRMQQRKARAIIRTLNGHDDVPHELMCPITHELMWDPVIAVDGQTYEREAIERVFEGGEKDRSPVTGVLLSSRLLIPNVAIRSQCRDYADKGRA